MENFFGHPNSQCSQIGKTYPGALTVDLQSDSTPPIILHDVQFTAYIVLTKHLRSSFQMENSRRSKNSVGTRGGFKHRAGQTLMPTMFWVFQTLKIIKRSSCFSQNTSRSGTQALWAVNKPFKLDVKHRIVMDSEALKKINQTPHHKIVQ